MKKKAWIISVLFVFGAMVLTGCQNTNKKDDSILDNNGVVEIDTSLTSDDFAKNKLTVLNIWATWCPPCVEELPELQKISETYKDKDVEIIGVLQDGIVELGTPNRTVINAANTLMQNANANYRIILPDAYLTTEFISTMQYFPTTFFLNSNGTVIETVVGANNYESWGRLIDEALEKLEA